MDIRIVYHDSNSRKNQIRQAIYILKGFQNYFNFILEESSDTDICTGNTVNWEEFYTKHQKDMETHSVFITEKSFDDNWFSHESSFFAVISTYDWESSFSPPSLKAYIVYQIAQAALTFEADLEENVVLNIVHFQAQGCMFDFCQDKNEIKLGMVSGSICPTCRSTLRTYGVSEEALVAIERILNCVRLEAIGKPVLQESNKAFVVMRFTKHDENDNAYQYGIIPALEDIGIKHFRADSRVLSAQLLDQIKSEISKSRFVIAKVDEENLNVYFELGLSMGLGKDVLLVSCEDLIIKLPTDLRNWECLTYPKGDYETLRSNIRKFFQDNYHY